MSKKSQCQKFQKTEYRGQQRKFSSAPALQAKCKGSMRWTSRSKFFIWSVKIWNFQTWKLPSAKQLCGGGDASKQYVLSLNCYSVKNKDAHWAVSFDIMLRWYAYITYITNLNHVVFAECSPLCPEFSSKRYSYWDTLVIIIWMTVINMELSYLPVLFGICKILHAWRGPLL